MPKFSYHPCKSATPTLDNHNILVQTPIYVFLDSTEISLSLEFNKMKFLAKKWAEQWARSQTVEERFVLVPGTYVFGSGLYLKCSELSMA